MTETAGDAIALRQKRIDRLIAEHLDAEAVDREAFRAELRTIKQGLSNYADHELTALVEHLRDRAVDFDERARLPARQSVRFGTGRGLGLGLSGTGLVVALLSVSGAGGAVLIGCGLAVAAMCRGEGDALEAEARFLEDAAQDFRDIAAEIGSRHVD